MAVSAIWFRLFKQSDLQTGPDLIANLFMILFFTWITIRLIHTIMISSRVTPNVIYGSISGYLLIGFTGAAWAATIEYIVPNSFVFPEQSIPTFQGFIYYSYITLSTLGYGDVLPVTGPAQSLSIFLSTVGQMYLTILVAFLVGKYINDNTLPPSK
ncbi:MAG: ion channel [Cyanobacteria bacterium P01_H01_bin.15]